MLSGIFYRQRRFRIDVGLFEVVEHERAEHEHEYSDTRQNRAMASKNVAR